MFSFQHYKVAMCFRVRCSFVLARGTTSLMPAFCQPICVKVKDKDIIAFVVSSNPLVGESVNSSFKGIVHFEINF